MSSNAKILDRYGVVDDVRNRRYLLEKVQHLVGGFGKAAGDPPGKATWIQRRIPIPNPIVDRSPPFLFRHGVTRFSERGGPCPCRSCAGH